MKPICALKQVEVRLAQFSTSIISSKQSRCPGFHSQKWPRQSKSGMAINTLVGYSRLIHTNRTHSTPAYTFSEWDPEMFDDCDALQPVHHHWKFMVPWCRYNSPRCLTQVATDGNPQEIRTDLWLKLWEDWVDISGQRWQSRLPGNITQNPTNFIQLVSIPLLDKMTTTGFKHLSTASCTCFFKDGYRNISIFLGQSPTVFLSHRTVAGSDMLPLDPVDCHPTWKMWLKQS